MGQELVGEWESTLVEAGREEWSGCFLGDTRKGDNISNVNKITNYKKKKRKQCLVLLWR